MVEDRRLYNSPIRGNWSDQKKILEVCCGKALRTMEISRLAVFHKNTVKKYIKKLCKEGLLNIQKMEKEKKTYFSYITSGKGVAKLYRERDNTYLDNIRKVTDIIPWSGETVNPSNINTNTGTASWDSEYPLTENQMQEVQRSLPQLTADYLRKIEKILPENNMLKKGTVIINFKIKKNLSS